MSKRLDSITRSATPAGNGTSAKPSLKFKPKVVSRKTKEERENAGTINTPGVNKIAEKNSRRLAKKPGAAAGAARGNKKMAGTQVVMSGPLSEGTISLGGSGSSSSSGNGAGSNAFNPLLQKLKSQSLAKMKKTKVKLENGDGSKIFNNDYDSDSDIDDNAIDMSKKSLLENNDKDADGDIDFDNIDTDLFPVRAERNEHHEYGEESKVDKTIKTEFHKDTSIIPSEPTTREGTVDPRGRTASPFGVDFNNSTTTGLNNGEDVGELNDYQEQQETIQINEDYDILSKSLKKVVVGNGEANNGLFFLQLPCSLPVLEGGLDGMIGKIRIHKSGKMTMKIGSVKFEISRGGSSDFVQDVILVDNINDNCYHVGNIREKITAIPKIV